MLRRRDLRKPDWEGEVRGGSRRGGHSVFTICPVFLSPFVSFSLSLSLYHLYHPLPPPFPPSLLYFSLFYLLPYLTYLQTLGVHLRLAQQKP